MKASNKPTKEIQLTFVRIVREGKTRAASDHRRMVNYAIVEYRCGEGQEYRKRFESYTTPSIPMHGENTEITKKEKQW